MKPPWRWPKKVLFILGGLATLLAWLVYRSTQPNMNYTKNIGERWFVEALPKYLPEPGPSPTNLYRAKGIGYVWVDERIRNYRFYEPDCVIYSTWRGEQDVFAVCGDRVPVAIESAFSSLKFDSEGLRKTYTAFLVGKNPVYEDELLPITSIKTVAAQQPRFHYGWSRRKSAAFDSANPPVCPPKREVPVQKVPAQGNEPVLIEVVRAHRLDLLTALLQAGANPNERADSGATALEIAAWSGYLPGLDALLAGHADVNTQDKFGATPLMRAADVGEKEAVKRLLAAGANIDLRDSENRTALERIPSSRDDELLSLLGKR